MNRSPWFRSGLCLALVWLLIGTSALAATGELRQREDVPDKYKWDLSSIFQNDEAWETAYASLDSNLGHFEEFKGRLAESPDMLLKCLKLRDSLNLILDNLYVYAYLSLDRDNRVSSFQEMSSRAGALYSRFGAATSFISPELTAIPNDRLLSFQKSTPELDMYRFYLKELLRSKEHILSEREEELLALGSPVTGAPSRIFSMINDADMKYGEIYDEDSNLVTLSKERYYTMLESSNRRVRRDANRAYNEAYLSHVNSLAATLTASVQRDYFLMQARHYQSCLDMKLDADGIPADVFHNLIDAVNNNLEPLHKWTALRKRMLGVDTMYSYDLYAPLIDEDIEIDYDDAKAKVLEGLQPLGNDYLAAFKQGLESRWVDVYENEGKGSGAYQWGTYSSHPFVLLNYNNSLENVFTLAHEMGHAMHQYYTNRHEPYIYSGHYLFTAEVASTANEAFLMKYMLEHAKTKKEKMALLMRYIDQIVGTFYTQVMFSEFELAIHDRIESGQALSADYMRSTYRDIYQKYRGPDVVIDSLNDLGCLRIGHFYRAYYVFQYATCYAAAQALSQQVLEDQPGALERYQAFLSTGSSKPPVDVLRDAGVDMETAEPIERTIKLFARLVDQMERMIDES